METYIDFIKKYNNEKSISSSDSEFDNFLKGGNSKKIKGGFPPVYSVDSVNSESFREFSPNLKIVDVLKKNPKTPFLNVNEGGFLNLFKSKQNKKDISKDEDISSVVLPQELEVVSIKSEKNQEKSNFVEDTSIYLPDELEIITINSVEDQVVEDKNEFVDEVVEDNTQFVDEVVEDNTQFVDEVVEDNTQFVDEDSNEFLDQVVEDNNEFVDQAGGENKDEVVDLDTSVELPEDIEVISLNSKNQFSKDYENTKKLPDITNTSENNVSELNEYSNTSENNVSELDEYSDTSNNFMSQLGGNNFEPLNNLNSEKLEFKNELDEDSNLDTSIDLPENIEVLTIENDNQLGGDDYDTSIDLPDSLEVVSIDDLNEISNNDLYQSGGEELDSIDLPNSLEVISIKDSEDDYLNQDRGDQDGGDIESYNDTSIDLPENLEVVSLNQDGGFFSDSSKDLFDSSIYLPNHVEVITLNRDEILDSVDTDSSILDILDIKSKDTKSIGNLFMKNFK